MSAWETWWQYVIVAALCTYFGLAVVVAVGGFFDVKKMFRRLNESHAREEERQGAAGFSPRGHSDEPGASG